MDNSWQPVKHDVSIAMPDLLDLSSLRGNASHLEGETPMPEDKPGVQLVSVVHSLLAHNSFA